MRVLFIGGTGIISTASTRLAIELGMDLTLLTRGQHNADVSAGATTLRADINDRAAVSKALEGKTFDVIVNWIAFSPSDVERDFVFRGKTRQYIFISSASAYQKPQAHYLITEATPLANPHWEYSRNKIACEERLMRAYRDDAFPVTIVRPSLTYGDTQIPLVMNSWTRPYTVVDRLLKGKKVIVPGDGTSLWEITHNTDFAKGIVGLMGHYNALGEAFHITSQEVRTWDQYYNILAEALGVPAHIIHIPSDFIIACLPEMEGTLIGDKSVSCVFDNSKIRRFVPGYRATTSFAEGIRRTLAWFNADSVRQVIDAGHDAMCDKLIDAYEQGLKHAVQDFSAPRR
jgi:nucleoside-diphosphate-sugar epimerase